MDNLSGVLLKEIEDSMLFCENSLYSFCLDNEIDIATVTKSINELIDDGKIVKLYFSVIEERMDTLPIGNNSFIVFKSKTPKMNDKDIEILTIGLNEA